MKLKDAAIRSQPGFAVSSSHSAGRNPSPEFTSRVLDLVKQALGSLEVGSQVTFADKVRAFAAALAIWGSRMNLIARSSDPAEVAFHIIDSLMPLVLASSGELGAQMLRDIFEGEKRILDFGSGAGLPGLMLAAALPHAHFTLIEAHRKKASFLTVATSEMGLRNVTIRSGHHTPGDLAPEFDALVSRASGPLARFHEVAAAVLAKGGIAILYANPDQRLALDVARRCGLAECGRVPYSLDRNGLTVKRILALFGRI